MKTLKTLLFIMICTASYTGCSENQTETTGRNNSDLVGSKWKLVSFVNGADGTAKTPDTSHSRKPYNYYWIEFKEDKTIYGHSSSNLLLGSYDINPDASEIQIKVGAATEVMERPDGFMFIDRLNSVRSFEYKESALLLYHNEIDYLLFEIYNDEKETPLPEISPAISGNWEVEMISISGELTNIGSPPDNASFPNISIVIPEETEGRIEGYTFYNTIGFEFEIKEQQQISFKNYGGTRIAEDEWGRAFSNHIRFVVKFDISNNELTFMDSQNNPLIVFIKKDNTYDTLPACMARTDNVSHYLTDHPTTILKEPFQNSQRISSYIVIAKWFDDTEPAAYLVFGFTTHRICNYPQYAKEWDIPENGLPVVLSGKVYRASFNPGFHPANRAFHDLELTMLKNELQ